jgi:ABC-type Fe3+-siderophore transport system permease subunit
LGKTAKLRYETLKYLDICMVLLIIVFLVGLLLNRQNLEWTYVPNVVTGFTTISGIIIAFIGLLISNRYTQKQADQQIWTKNRFLGIIAAVFLSIVLVISGLFMLANGDLALAYKLSSMGTALIFWLLFDVAMLMCVDLTKDDVINKKNT